MMNVYNFEHDFAHTTGYVDEDLDWELPDPAGAMHYKKKRSGALMFLGAFISVGALILYPICGLKIPGVINIRTGIMSVFKPTYSRRRTESGVPLWVKADCTVMNIYPFSDNDFFDIAVDLVGDDQPEQLENELASLL